MAALNLCRVGNVTFSFWLAAADEGRQTLSNVRIFIPEEGVKSPAAYQLLSLFKCGCN
jgi:hypothetical protein